MKPNVVNIINCGLATLGILLAGLDFQFVGTSALAMEENTPRRHSLLQWPVGTPHRALDSEESSNTAPSIHSAKPSSSQRKLTKRLVPDSTIPSISDVSSESKPIAQLLKSETVSGSPSTNNLPPQTLPATQTLGYAARASSSNITVTATAPTSVLPLASAATTQPIAAAGGQSSSGKNTGSRSAKSLFKNKELVRLLQAPPPPSVTPPSTPPTTSPTTTTNTTSSTPPTSTPPPSQPVTTTGSAMLSWILGSEADLAGYKIYVGTSSGNYTYPGSPFTAGRVNTYTFTNLPVGQTYFFALSANDAAGNTSPMSVEVSKQIF